MKINMQKKIGIVILFLCAMLQTTKADVDGEYQFEGTLGDKIPVVITFCVNGDGIAVGEIYYPKAKNPAPILIVGEALEWGYSMNEYQNDGTITGCLSFKIEEDAAGPYMTEGTWTNPKTRKEFPLKNMKCVSTSVDVPKFLDYEDPQNIGREYSFKIWNEGAQDYMGGHISFRGAGKHKLHFEVGNVRHNIAEGRSAPDRPAVLGDYTYDYFNYENVNECGYSFSAHFFKRFVVLKTTSDYHSLDCFGAGASFDGVYMKIKQ